MSGKTLTDRQLLGERGVALINQLVLGMGHVFRPTGTLDAGIDGEIEIRNIQTGRVTNQIIKVQSKAVSQFQSETSTGFDYWPTDDDVKYWLGGNVPVILVLSRPDTTEAYWVSVQAYKAKAGEKTKKIHFDKTTDRLDATAAPRLAELVRDSHTGAYSPPVIKRERLLSNLLPVTRLPTHIHIAGTDLRARQDVVGALQAKAKNFGTEWILKNKQVMSFQDLRERPYSEIFDIGTAEEFPLNEWADSDDAERQRDFVALLNVALRNKLRPLGIRFEGRAPFSCYYVQGNLELKPVPFGYSGGKKQTNREVFRPYHAKTGEVSYCRHSAFGGQFYRLGGQWYLEVTPTYYFTSDGIEHLERYEALLKGIKRLEKNNAVRGQLVMWAQLLTHDGDMFNQAYPYLAFGQPEAFDIDVGIDESVWLDRETVEADLINGQSSLALEGQL